MSEFSNISPADLEKLIQDNDNKDGTPIPVINIDKIVDLAVEVWRLKTRLKKYDLKITEDQNKIIDNSFERINRFFDICEIEVKDYTHAKYISELNIDPISFEEDKNLPYPTIIETIEPQVSIKDKVYKKSKVIVANP